MHVVLMNGPIGSGKTTFAKELKGILEQQLGHKVILGHFKDGLIKAVIAEWQKENDDRTWDGSYETLRAYIFQDGQTGRDKMIQLGEILHRDSPDYLPSRAWAFVEPYLRTPAIIIFDDCGRVTEWEIFEKRLPPGSVHLVYMERPKGFTNPAHHGHYKIYEHGQRFDSDNRYCLKDFSNWLPDPDVIEIAAWLDVASVK